MLSYSERKQKADGATYTFAQNGDLTIVHGITVFPTNFSGEADGRYNTNHSRLVNIVVPDPIAQRLAEEGWNVQEFVDKNTGDVILNHIQVVVDDDKNDMEGVALRSIIKLCTEYDGVKTKTRLDRTNVGLLDSMDISDITCVIHPFYWNGVNAKGHVRSMTIVASERPTHTDPNWDNEYYPDYSEV